MAHARTNLRPVLVITLVAITTLIIFAGSSLLARMAFLATDIDPASFTAIRIISGAITLYISLRLSGEKTSQSTSGWTSAILYFIYALAFSYAYRDLNIGTGAVILIVTAQLFMVTYGIYQKNEKTSIWGILIVIGGLITFLSPKITAPPLVPAILMTIAGLAWGGFSVVHRSNVTPLAATANSFIFAVPFALALLWLNHEHLIVDHAGISCALVTGIVTSAIGNIIWYWVRVQLTSIVAGTSLLAVPLFSMLFGVIFLDEIVTVISIMSTLVILGGLLLVTLTTVRQDK